MNEPIYFVVTLRQGHEELSVYRGHLPSRVKGKITTLDENFKAVERPIIAHGWRLDRLPQDHPFVLHMNDLQRLSAIFTELRAADQLPGPNWADPPAKKGKTTLGFGERTNFTRMPWHGRAPDPFPDPDTLRRKPHALVIAEDMVPR